LARADGRIAAEVVVVPPEVGGMVGRPRSALRVLWRVENGVRCRLIHRRERSFSIAPNHTRRSREGDRPHRQPPTAETGTGLRKERLV